MPRTCLIVELTIISDILRKEATVCVLLSPAVEELYDTQGFWLLLRSVLSLELFGDFKVTEF